MQLFKSLEQSITRHLDRKAFCIDGKFFTYRELFQKINGIRQALRQHGSIATKRIGLVLNDDLETYAAIIAIWFEGAAYVPLSTLIPAERNRNMILQAGVKLIIDSSELKSFEEITVIDSLNLDTDADPLIAQLPVTDQLAYIVFTSGSTGIPKGVPVSVRNLSNFADAFFQMGIQLNENDRCLQMFELTFDLSVMSYLVPLLKGACVYTIPKNQIKYNYIFRLLDEEAITIALMIPTVILYLQPYFEEIHCPALRYSLFCGEALPADVTVAWSHCIPNATIFNVYGPSEATIFCTYYVFQPLGNNKSQNGILSIGKAMEGMGTIIIDENNQPLPVSSAGELCLSGGQITPGYLENEEKNRQAFLQLEQDGGTERFYKTGDLCLMDPEGDILYLGRIDSQVKIQGYRVELSEVEFHAKKNLVKTNVVALPFRNEAGSQEIVLVIESDPFNTAGLISRMKQTLPFYMIPIRVSFEPVFPLNNNGKIDRKEMIKKLM